MINIILENSDSRILGLGKPSLLALRTSVCYFNMSMYIRTRNTHAARTFLIDENGFFPTGLLKRIQDWLFEKNFEYQVIDNRVIPNSKKLNLVNLLNEPKIYPEQKEASEILFHNSNGTVEMPTGIGKSRTIKEVIFLHCRPTLVITPSSNLKVQMFDYLKACFGEKFVGYIDKKKPKPITVTNYHAVASMDPRFFDGFDVIIFDEYHNAANNTMREIDKTHFKNIYYKYGLTATNFKNDDYENILLECVLSNNLYSVSTLNAINKKYIVPVVPIFYNLKNDNLVSLGDYRKDFKIFMDNNQEKNRIAIEQAIKMIEHNIPTLILVEHVEHGRYIQASIKNSIFLNGQDNKASWNMEQIKKFNDRLIPCIVGTSVIGEGVDTKACGAIINLAGGKAKSELLQRVGRCVRNFPDKKVGFYIDFIDNGQKNLLSHSKKRISIIEETYGTKIRMVE